MLPRINASSMESTGEQLYSLIFNNYRSSYSFSQGMNLQLQDEFPIFLCYSAQSGTGILSSCSILMVTALICCIIVLGKSTSEKLKLKYIYNGVILSNIMEFLLF